MKTACFEIQRKTVILLSNIMDRQDISLNSKKKDKQTAHSSQKFRNFHNIAKIQLVIFFFSKCQKTAETS